MIGIALMALLFVAVLFGSVRKAVLIDYDGLDPITEASAQAAEYSEADGDLDAETEVFLIVGKSDIEDINEAIGAVKDAGEQASSDVPANAAWYIILAAFGINILTNLMKTRLFKRVLKIIQPKYRVYFPLLFGLVVAILSLVIGRDPLTAVYLLFSGPTAIALHETLFESLLNQAESRKKL